LDRALGDALESTVHAHHCRRLRKIGHGRALDPPLDGDVWPRDAASPRRSGNSVDVLIDGAKALPAIDEAIRGARSGPAGRYCSVVSWSLPRPRGWRVPVFRGTLATGHAEHVD
jgi:hypothetical protein